MAKKKEIKVLHPNYSQIYFHKFSAQEYGTKYIIKQIFVEQTSERIFVYLSRFHNFLHIVHKFLFFE